MSQKLGQNFLIDSNVAKREIKYADIKHNDIVLEIGPGKGILTKLLANSAKKVIAIEIDKSLIDRLKKTIPDNVEIIHGDCLKIDFKILPKFNKIVSNLPFQISSPITFKFLEHDFKLAVLIYQKEFADRMIAKAGSKDYSRLSVGIYYKTKCELLETIPKTCFRPQPKVDSCIIRLAPIKTPPFKVFNEIFFQNMTKNLFNNRRKKIKNTLEKNYGISFDEIPYLDKRIEDLTPEQIGELSNILYERMKIKN
jgi:16S rRNA (adenine1518-N6/adenine1519-N6)-dimethyltransferase